MPNGSVQRVELNYGGGPGTVSGIVNPTERDLNY